MYPDVSLTIAKIDSIPPENSGYVRADGDHKRILRFHQSATAHWLWDNQTLSNPHRDCSVCSTDPFQCDFLCRPRYTVVSYASANTTCSQTFPSKWEGHANNMACNECWKNKEGEGYPCIFSKQKQETPNV